jgi:cytochrome P450
MCIYATFLNRISQAGKDEPTYREIRQALGNGMLTSEGAVWRRQRRMLAPIFTPRRIAGSYVSIMVDEAQQLADRWGERPAGVRLSM